MLKGNLEADYFLFINGKAVGVLEAKREDIDALSDKVCDQAVLYAKSVPPVYQTYQKPLPFIFTSNGKELYFCDFREQEQSFRQIMSIPTPYELVKRLGIIDWFAGLPTLQKKGLRDCQYEAVTELEKSFRSGQNRALMVLATGAGKTYTACLAAYRLLSYTPMQRILFLVDRNNLGKQAEGEFGTFRLTENGDAFNTIFTVTRLKSANIPSDSNVVISTIQRLFSLLKGEEIADDDKADDEPDIEEDVVLPSNPNLPHDFFDLIIIDECHRSIYKSWKQVLEYFDTARLIGLTATPIPETKAFFNYNMVVNYTLEQSIADGVNVECRTYRVKTRETEEGGAILEGQRTKVETRYTGEVKTVSNKETKTYTKEELNRSIINPAQIKLILSTYRDIVYTELFNDPPREPNMDYLPDNYLRRLAGTLSRLYNKADNAQREQFAHLAHKDMKELAIRIYAALENDTLPPYNDINEPNNERKGLVSPIANHAEARKYILILAAGFVNTLMPGEDELIFKGFSTEEAQNDTEAFEQYCKDHCDDIEALRIIYNNQGEPITFAMLKDLENKLKMESSRFSPKRLWNSYATISPDKVKRTSKKQEAEALTNLIQLVRFAYHQIERLESVFPSAKQFFNLWCGQKQGGITDKQREVMSRIVDYIASNGACTVKDIREDDATQAAQMIQAFGNMQKADDALRSLYTFVVLRKAA